jgi:hypothetical protein
MAERLFGGSWYHARTSAVQQAVADVNKLDRRVFSDPALGNRLKEIVEKYSVEIARLNTDGITADAVEEEHFSDDYGRRRSMKIKRLRVKIPFTGETESLKIAPSTSTIPSHRAEIGQNSLTITIADDDNAEREVKTFCDQVQGNLDTLRQEYERDYNGQCSRQRSVAKPK